MKEIFLSELSYPLETVNTLLPAYLLLKLAAEQANDLRAYLKANLMIESLAQARAMQESKEKIYAALAYTRANRYNIREAHYNYSCEPFFLYVEDQDSIDDILKKRFSFVYNGAFA